MLVLYMERFYARTLTCRKTFPCKEHHLYATWGDFTQELTTLRGETILQECVTRFIDLAFCSRCVRATPPLCFNTCNALLRACYSPYYTVLNRQYNQLWNVVQRTVQVANSTVQGLLTGESVILNIDSIVSCNYLWKC